MQFIKSILVLAFAVIGMAAPADAVELVDRQESACTCSGTVTVTVPAVGLPPTVIDSSALIIATPPGVPPETIVTPPVYGTDTVTPIVPVPTDPAVPLPGTEPNVSEPAVTGPVTDTATAGLPPASVSSFASVSFSSTADAIGSSTSGVTEPTPTAISQAGGVAPTGAFGLGAMLGGAALIAMVL